MSYKHWTEEEDRYLMDNFPDNTNGYLARKMGRTVASVKYRAVYLDLEKSFSHKSRMGKRTQKLA